MHPQGLIIGRNRVFQFLKGMLSTLHKKFQLLAEALGHLQMRIGQMRENVVYSSDEAKIKVIYETTDRRIW